MNFISLAVPSVKKFQRIFKGRNNFVLILLILGAILVSGGIYYGLFRFLDYVGRAPMLGKTLGPIIGGLLVSKLLEMIFLTLFFMVLFSSIISAFTSLFLSEELKLLMTSPQSIGTIFRSRFFLMSIESSWMVLAFFIPAFFCIRNCHESQHHCIFCFSAIFRNFCFNSKYGRSHSSPHPFRYFSYQTNEKSISIAVYNGTNGNDILSKITRSRKAY